MSRRRLIKRGKISRIRKIERRVLQETLDQMLVDQMIYGSSFCYVEKRRLHRVHPEDVQIEIGPAGPNPIQVRPVRRQVLGIVRAP